MRVLVTGAGGFVGGHLLGRLAAAGFAVRAQVRTGAVNAPAEVVATGDLARYVEASRWQPLLSGVDAVVHLAAVTHAGDVDESAAWRRYETVNVAVTRALACAARAAGVGAFVMMSSVKVCGERSPRTARGWRALSARDTPQPEDNYGRSKWLAEQALAACAGDMRTTVLRPPLLYGPGMKGNLPRLFDAIARRRPLPFALIQNQRSLLGVDNLVDAVCHALRVAPPGVATYTLSDVDLSTPALVRAIGAAFGVEARLWPCPPSVLRGAGRLLGRGAAVRRLTDSLICERETIAQRLDWHPPRDFAEGLAASAAWYGAARR
ncbi:MAG: NAD-dependent epimerase/dehydratase family protein [Gammaproteobacteria bacterium]